MGSAGDGSGAAAADAPAGTGREAADDVATGERPGAAEHTAGVHPAGLHPGEHLAGEHLAGQDPAGEHPAAGTPSPVGDGSWAICCSGGGIRSASFCLGALQRLQLSGLLPRAGVITSVSGGSYITASRALVAHGLAKYGPAPTGPGATGPGGTGPGQIAAPGQTGAQVQAAAYAPGSPEEQHLRDNTHYLAPDPTILLLGILSIVVGVVFTFLLVATPLFAVAHAWGWLLRGQGVLCPGSAPGCDGSGGWTASISAWWWWLAPAILGGLTFLAFWWWWLALVPGRPRRRDRSQADGSGSGQPGEPDLGQTPSRDHSQTLASLVGWAVVITTAVAVAMLVVPLLLAWLSKLSPGPFKSLADDLGFTAGRRWTPAALAGTFAAVLAVSASVRGKLQQWHVLTTPGQAPSGSPSAGRAPATTVSTAKPGLLGQIGSWIRIYLLPWLASAVIVLALAVAGLRWVRDGAATGYSPSVSWLVTGAILLMLILRLLVDVNRISMHDFYRWRLASAYAVIRRPRGATPGRARRGAAAGRVQHAPGVCLSSLAGEQPVPVFCTTANINAERQVPVGRGGLSLTFDPEQVHLRGEGPVPGVTARTKDYETLVGRQRLALFDVSAISGAAVSPLMGAATRQAYRILLTATNVRLGVWLPHPAVVKAARSVLDGQRGENRLDHWPAALGLLLWYVLPHPRWRTTHRKPGQSEPGQSEPQPSEPGQSKQKLSTSERSEARLWAYLLRVRDRDSSRFSQFVGGQFYRLLQPTLGLLWAEAAGHTSYRSTWICVSDGGHYDNLGLVEALCRGASNIVVLDASGDKVNSWFTLGGSIAQARDDAGVDITLNPTVMCPTTFPHAGEVKYPWTKGSFAKVPDWPAGGPVTAEAGTIWVVKLGWWRGAPWDVEAYALGHPTFPTDPTLYQLFNDAEFDAYRELGMNAAEAALAAGLGE